MSQQKPCLEVPSLRRRKRDNDAVDDSVGDSPLVMAFDDIESMDAASYLSRVRAQARRLPEISKASPVQPTTKRMKRSDDEVITGSAASLHYMLSSCSSSSATNGSGIQPPPSLQQIPANANQWVDQTMASFSRLRRYLEQCQSQGVGRDKSQRILVPSMKDSRGWCTFCVGEGSDDDNDKDDNTNNGDGAPAWRTNLPAHGYTPTVSLLLQLDQVMVRRVLGHLTDQFCEYHQKRRAPASRPDGLEPMHERLLSWLYALTARLERPIHRDDAVTLYTLLKTLTAARRATLPTTLLNRRKLAILNVLIVVVGIYLEQGGGYANVMEVKV